MHNKYLKKVWAAFSLVAMLVPSLPMSQVLASTEESGLIYANDFEKEAVAVDLGGNKALAYEVKGDKSNAWLSIFQQDLQFEYNEAIHSGATLSFDVLIPEAATYTGSFKAQAVTKMGKDWRWTQCEAIPEINSTQFTDAGNGFKKASISISFGKEIEAVQGLKAIVPCLAASNCSYSGKIYLDNVKLVNGKATITEPVIVKSTVNIKKQTPVAVTETAITANGKKVVTSEGVKLTDEKASKAVAQVYAYLEAIGNTDCVLYGHQNDTHHKAGSKTLTNSDTKDVTGSLSAVVGIDTLSLTGNEFPGGLSNQYPKTLSKQELVSECAKVTKEAAKEGAIITLSAHMPNFATMANREANKPNKDGTLNWEKADFLSKDNNTDGAWVTTGNVANQIMPGGKLNYLFNAYLDMIAAYANEVGPDVPILFRPFHENTGSWFWWGAAFCDEEGYKNLYRYTVEYLRDQKGVHNMLYVYGPGAEAESVADYERRYPGDDYVDMVGFDMYHQYPTEGDSFIDHFKTELKIVEKFATKHHKLFAVTETGIANGNEVLLKGGNARKDWYNEIIEAISPTKASYFLLWANFSTNQHYTPYVVSKEGSTLKGHEMLDNFIDFYNNAKSVFAAQQGDFSKLNVKTEKNEVVTGYFRAPVSGSRILSDTKITASIKHENDKAMIKFVVKNKTGNITKTLQAKKDATGQYVATLLEKDLKALGENTGTIALVVDDKQLSKISGKFNMPEPTKVPTVVDTFEDYYGDQEVLNTSWSVGKGTGCSLEPTLTNKHYAGKYSLQFKYNLIAGGYAGVTKSLGGVDWSTKNALQLWTIPDGKNQKVVVQVTSGGNVFEVYLNEYEAYKGKTAPVLVTVPFSAFVGRDDKKAVFNPKMIDSFGLWCNAIVPEGKDETSYSLSSTIYYDDIKAVTSDVKAVTFTNK